MPKKSKKETKIPDDDDSEAFVNSEEDYASEDPQTGGDDTENNDTEDELGDDTVTIDIDPNDEKDPNEDDKYDPVEESEELEDEVIEVAAEEEEEEEEEEEDIAETGKACHLKNLNSDIIILDEDDSSTYGKMEYKRIADEDRETDAIMTYYEIVRVIGTRAQQFNFGAEPLVMGIDNLSPPQMAYVELISKMTPYIIRRPLPGKKYEDWTIDELEIIHTINDDFFVPGNFDWEALAKPSKPIR